MVANSVGHRNSIGHRSYLRRPSLRIDAGYNQTLQQGGAEERGAG